MIDAQYVADALSACGYTQYVGVPCSYLTPLINHVISNPSLKYIGATNEGDALAIGMGAHLAGRKTVVICQNSGLGNMVNPLTSLNHPFNVPALLMITWRGDPMVADEPQHEQIGSITPGLLDLLGIHWDIFPDSKHLLADLLNKSANRLARNQRPVALLLRAKSICGACDSLPESPTRHTTVAMEWISSGAPRPSRVEAIHEILRRERGDEVYIATTGHTGRELFSIEDRPNNLYVVGGMGTAPSIGFGIAEALPKQPVVVLDGDGALLMRMGVLATIGRYGPQNLLHIVFDNECYRSTGGQPTASSVVRFDKCAAAANYRCVLFAEDKKGLSSALEFSRQQLGPTMLHLKTQPESPSQLPRPALTPVQVKDRVMDFLRRNKVA